VASIKVPLMVAELSKHPDVAVQVAATTSSLTFYTSEEVLSQARQARAQAPLEDRADDDADPTYNSTSRFGIVDVDVDVWTDAHEWGVWRKIGDPILHIELRRWADIVLVAPCSANMLAKISNGICDNLATSILRALPPTTLTYIFPAMNTAMYLHPLTAKQLRIVTDEIGYKVVGPQPGKNLACGDVGPGAMTEWKEIVQLVVDQKQALINKNEEAALTAY